MFEYAAEAAFILHATPPISQVQVHNKRRKKMGFFSIQSLNSISFLFVYGKLSHFLALLQLAQWEQRLKFI